MGPHRTERGAAAAGLARALVAALAAALGACGDGGAERPNVLLVSIDSLRRDHVSAYGYQNPLRPDLSTMPAVDRLAAEGVLFLDAVSTTSWTLPAHVALLTGLPDRVHGVTGPEERLDPALDTLAELLRARGWATAGFFSGPNLHPAFGFGQGFDRYVNCSEIHVPLDAFSTEDPDAIAPYHRDSHSGLTSPRLFDESAAWIRERVGAGERFFAFVHWWDPHYDYAPAEEYRALFDPSYSGRATGENWIHSREVWSQREMGHILSLYDAEIRYTDDHVARLLALLDELGVADDTLVVVTSDHGDEFYEHGKKGHQRTLYDESVRIPLVMRWPGHLPAGVRPQGQARIQDVLPTVADLCDVPAPAYVAGRSLRPLWEDPEHPGFPQHLDLDVAFRGFRLSGLRLSDRKVVWDHEAGEGLVFDLERDPGEGSPRRFRDLDTAPLPAAAELRDALRELERRRAELPSTPGHSGALLPDSLVQEMKRLGYL